MGPDPFAVVGQRKLNFGSGWDVRPPGEGWVNLDGFVEHPNVVRHDFTRFPYPFPTDHFDAVYAENVFEHIPFLYLDHNGTARDVLFAIIDELSRILRPDGRLHILVPLRGTAEAKEHPGHYREYSPETFSYFGQGASEGEEPSKYHAAGFAVERIRFRRRAVRHPDLLRIGPRQLGVETHLQVRFPRLFESPFLRWTILGKNHMEAVLANKKGSQSANKVTHARQRRL